MGFKVPFSTARNRFKGQNLLCCRDLAVNLTRKRSSVLRRLKIRICFQDYQAIESQTRLRAREVKRNSDGTDGGEECVGDD